MLNLFNSATAEVCVFTFAEGLLSAVAHDLQLSVGSFELEIDKATRQVRGGFRSDSLVVLHAIKAGRPSPSSLSARDRAKIEENLRDVVLHSKRFPSIAFEGTASSEDRVTGALTLHGVTRPMVVQLRVESGVQVAEATVHQPDFGITPYRAMMGTLKVRADVRVVVRLRRGEG